MSSVGMSAVSAPPINPNQGQPSGSPSAGTSSSGGTRVWNDFHGRDPDLIFAGETLKLPNGQTVTAQDGDSLSSIAAANSVTVDQLIEANGFDRSLSGQNGPNGAWFTPGGPTPAPGGSVNPTPTTPTPSNGGTPAPDNQGNAAATSTSTTTGGANGLPTPEDAAGMLRGMKPQATGHNPPPDDFRGSEGGQLRGLLKQVAAGETLTPDQQQQLKSLLDRWTPTIEPAD
jgi:hypothetical protein